MKTRKRERPSSGAPAFSLKFWHCAVGALGALLVVFEVYQPALHGPFVFDDIYLPIYSHYFAERPLLLAIKGVRPFLMFTFWLNHRVSGLEPYGYHVFNVLFHFFNALLVFGIVRRVLKWAGEEGWRRESLSAFAGGLFLLHPVQTESVAYVASRSETVSILFFYSAFALFLYRKSPAISWREVFGVLLLFGAAASTKEHTVVLPALLLLTDYFWNPGFSLRGIWRNWRLYAPLAIAATAGLAFVWKVLSGAITAGFAMKELPWHHYFFTQCRAIWVYFRLLVIPAGQNADYDYPISRTIFDHGAIAGLIGLLVLAGCAFYFRKRYPLACYGILAALILLAPTSSIVPIRDAVAERRLYLPMIGLLFVPLELLRRWKTPRAKMIGAFAVVLAVAGFLSYQRNKVWSSPIALWGDTVAKSPHNSRAHFQLALAYYDEGRCAAAVEHYETVARLQEPDHRLLVDWALADDCLNRGEEALDKLRRAAALDETAHVYALIGMMHGKQGRPDESLAALDKAIEIDPDYDMTYVYRGNIYTLRSDYEGAAKEYRRALELNPRNQSARDGLLRAEALLRRLR
jgi:tetratricopeptide (TPR) repeat protein